jgi:uncharacterized protein (TIGR02145 family)
MKIAMKKNLLLLLAGGFLLAGCTDGTSEANEAPVCKITEPVAKTLRLGEDLVIKGEGSDVDGKIVKVTLTVGGKRVTEVTTVPFTHTVEAEDITAGEIAIRLEVEDDRGAKGADEITVTVAGNSAPRCEITEPVDRARMVKEGGLTIRAAGEDEDGEIVSVALKINDDVVEDLTLPLEYSIRPEDLSAGPYEITLEVTDNTGAVGTDKVVISVENNLAPEVSITAPGNNSKIALENGLTITAEGNDPEGKLERVTLKVGGVAVTSVNSLPVNHRIEPADLREGPLAISIEVEDNYGATDKEEVTVEIVKPQAGSMVDSRDGKTYRVVEIGTQTWMAENMAYLPVVHSPTVGSEQDGNENKQFNYVYGYDGNDVAAAKATQNYATYGVLYNWYAAREICPSGWHLPNKEEWAVLTQYVYDNIEPTQCYEYDWQDNKVEFEEYNVAGALRSTEGWEPFNEPGRPGLGAGSDQFGFGAQAFGKRLAFQGSGNFYYINQQCNFWTSDGNADNDEGAAVYVDRISYNVSAGNTGAERGQGVRCLKD